MLQLDLPLGLIQIFPEKSRITMHEMFALQGS